MQERPITLESYPRAILHIDADAFFASVEQALSPSLRGKPVVTGAERNIIACASYEAKRLGISRGMPLFEARRICPSLCVLPSDYETYSLYSRRMFDIIRNFTPDVEEYSIDEAFADITGMRRCFRASYEDIARMVAARVCSELGITVSVGLSLSKSLAKICSKFRKPEGITPVPGRYIHILLKRTALDKVWGFGASSVNLLKKFGLETAYDFILKPESWASKYLHKPGREIWHELRGNSVWPVSSEVKNDYASITKSKTFTPPSLNKDYVFARLVRNIESAFIKARRHNLRAGSMSVVLRDRDFRHTGLEVRFSRSTSSFLEAVPLARELFGALFDPVREYRATMVVLGRMESDNEEQYTLFQSPLKAESSRRLSMAVDQVAVIYGKHKIHSGAAMCLDAVPVSSREIKPERRVISAKGETARKRIGIPRMDIKV